MYDVVIPRIMTSGAKKLDVNKKHKCRSVVMKTDFNRKSCGILKNDIIRNEDIKKIMAA